MATGGVFRSGFVLLLLSLSAPGLVQSFFLQPKPCGLLKHSSFVLFSKRVVTPQGVMPAAVLVQDGVIRGLKRVASASAANPFLTPNLPLLDYSNAVVSPGLVDVHVHLNEPGRVEWEGVTTGTKAAAAGGVTTVVDMPLNSMPTVTSKETLQEKLAAVKGKLSVDMGFWGGLVPENAGSPSRLEDLLKAGVLGLKSFMCPSGINDFPDTNATHFEAALPLLAKYGLPLLVHAEVPLPLEQEPSEGDPRKYATYEASRPPQWEAEAIKRALAAFSEARPGGAHEGAKLHIVHLADESSISTIQQAKDAGLAVTVETCPHYLAFSNAQIADGDTRYKCAPPIRSQENQEALWRGLKAGEIELLSSDHSPCSPELKLMEEGNFLKAWGGISGLQLSLPVTWTFGQAHNVTLMDLAQWWSARPAALANLGSKGEIAVGKDADFVIWSPESNFKVEPETGIFHKHKVTPYAGLTLSGEVIATFVRGQMVYDQGQHPEKPCGSMVLAL